MTSTNRSESAVGPNLTKNWRKSVRKVNDVVLDYKELKKRRVAAIKDQNHLLTSFKGLSLSFLNDFWKDVRNEKILTGTKLYIVLKTTEGVSRGTTVCKVESDEDLYRCLESQSGKTFTIAKQNLKFKNRKYWTCRDISRYLIAPQTKLSGKPFVEDVKESKTGKEFEGYNIVCSEDCVFEELLLSLRDYVKLVGTAPAEVCYFWFEIFSVNKSLLRKTDTKSDFVKKEVFKSYREDILASLELFDTRFIYFTSWKSPCLFSCLSCVWQLFHMFDFKCTFEVLAQRDVAAKFAQVYDSDEPLMFEAIEDIDPSIMVKEVPFVADLIIEELTTGQLEGLKTVRSKLYDQFELWILHEVESDVKRIQDSRDQRGMEKFAIFLYKTGNFFSKHRELLVAKSYFKRALENFYELQLFNEEQAEKKKLKQIEETTLSEQLAVDKVNGGASKVHLLQALVALAEKNINKAKLELRKSEEEAVKVVTQKHAFLYDISEARVELHLVENEPKHALGELASMALILRHDMSHTSRVKFAKVLMKQASCLLTTNDFVESQSKLNEALKVFKELNSSKYRKEVIDIFLELGRACFKQKKDDEAITNYEKALDLQENCFGKLNDRAGFLCNRIGHTYGRKGKDFRKESLKYFRKAIDAYKMSQGASSFKVVDLSTAEAFLLKSIGQFDEAEETCLSALKNLDNEAVIQVKLGRDLTPEEKLARDDLRAKIFSFRGMIQEAQQDHMKAIGFYKTSFEISKKSHGEDDKVTNRRKQRWEKSEELARRAKSLHQSS